MIVHHIIHQFKIIKSLKKMNIMYKEFLLTLKSETNNAIFHIHVIETLLLN